MSEGTDVALTPSPGDRDVPAAHVGTLAPNYYCRAWNPRREKYCRSRAGTNTDHKGIGRCKTHGGGGDERVTHGQHRRYATITAPRLRELIAQHEADPDPLNILPELAAARGLFQDFVERYEPNTAALLAWHESYLKPGEAALAKPRQVLDIADAYRIVSEITKIVERIESIRAANAITYRQLQSFLFAVRRVIEAHVSDPDTCARVFEDIGGIRV